MDFIQDCLKALEGHRRSHSVRPPAAPSCCSSGTVGLLVYNVNVVLRSPCCGAFLDTDMRHTKMQALASLETHTHTPRDTLYELKDSSSKSDQQPRSCWCAWPSESKLGSDAIFLCGGCSESPYSLLLLGFEPGSYTKGSSKMMFDLGFGTIDGCCFLRTQTT